MEPRGRAAILGLAAVVFLWTWQFLTVHYNYGGNWTALFRIRPGMPVPDFLKAEPLYTFPGTEGYDGQVYHLIAHDPFMRRGSAAAITDAPFRYQRIFVPALAWVLALGQDRWIDRSYITVILGFAFLGVYWLALIAARFGLSPECGWAFILAPATIVSIDRMTVDIALAALAVGFAYHAGEGGAKVIAILTCALLTRETALPILAGFGLYLLTQRRFLEASATAAATLPALGWFIFLSHHGTPSSALTYVDWIPLAGMTDRLLHPVIYDLPPFKRIPAQILDYVALTGIFVTLILAARWALKRRWDAPTSALYGLAIAAIFIRSRSVWEDVNAFGRVLTPLLLLTAIQDFGCFPWLAAAAMFLVDTRISLDLWSQVSGVFHGIIK